MANSIIQMLNFIEWYEVAALTSILIKKYNDISVEQPKK